MAIPEPVVETVVPESVQVTESKPSVTITVFEPIQKPSQTLPTTITKANLHLHHHQFRPSNQHPLTYWSLNSLRLKVANLNNCL